MRDSDKKRGVFSRAGRLISGSFRFVVDTSCWVLGVFFLELFPELFTGAPKDQRASRIVLSTMQVRIVGLSSLFFVCFVGLIFFEEILTAMNSLSSNLSPEREGGKSTQPFINKKPRRPQPDQWPEKPPLKSSEPACSSISDLDAMLIFLSKTEWASTSNTLKPLFLEPLKTVYRNSIEKCMSGRSIVFLGNSNLRRGECLRRNWRPPGR